MIILIIFIILFNFILAVSVSLSNLSSVQVPNCGPVLPPQHQQEDAGAGGGGGDGGQAHGLHRQDEEEDEADAGRGREVRGGGHLGHHEPAAADVPQDPAGAD